MSDPMNPARDRHIPTPGGTMNASQTPNHGDDLGPDYDAEDRCRHCGEHVADPHRPNCPGASDDDAQDDDACHASYETGGSDPYGTDCDLPRGHAGRHSGPDPIDPDGGRRVLWSGGGSAGGDPLPFRNVEWVQQ